MVRYQVGQVYDNNRLNLVSMQLSDFQPIGPVPTSEGTMKLMLNFSPKGNVMGPQSFSRKMLLGITFDVDYNGINNPNVKNCRAVGGAAEQIWTQKPNGDIYYEGGNVGVGTTNPSVKLDVNGKIRGQLDCRRVQSAPDNLGASARADCAADEYVISGGGYCNTINPFPGFLHASLPKPDLSGRDADCFKFDYSVNVQATAFAICCKIGTP